MVSLRRCDEPLELDASIVSIMLLGKVSRLEGLGVCRQAFLAAVRSSSQSCRRCCWLLPLPPPPRCLLLLLLDWVLWFLAHMHCNAGKTQTRTATRSELCSQIDSGPWVGLTLADRKLRTRRKASNLTASSASVGRFSLEDARVNPQEGYDRYELTGVLTRERKTGILGNNSVHSLAGLLGAWPLGSWTRS